MSARVTGSVSPDLMFYLSLPQSSFSIPISVTVILLGSIVTLESPRRLCHRLGFKFLC